MIDEKTGLQTLNELTDMLQNIPENRPLYKDSGLWQVRSDDMEEIYFQQKVNESFYEFIKRVFHADNPKVKNEFCPYCGKSSCCGDCS